MRWVTVRRKRLLHGFVCLYVFGPTVTRGVGRECETRNATRGLSPPESAALALLHSQEALIA